MYSTDLTSCRSSEEKSQCYICAVPTYVIYKINSHSLTAEAECMSWIFNIFTDKSIFCLFSCHFRDDINIFIKVCNTFSFRRMLRIFLNYYDNISSLCHNIFHDRNMWIAQHQQPLFYFNYDQSLVEYHKFSATRVQFR